MRYIRTHYVWTPSLRHTRALLFRKMKLCIWGQNDCPEQFEKIFVHNRMKSIDFHFSGCKPKDYTDRDSKNLL